MIEIGENLVLLILGIIHMVTLVVVLFIAMKHI
ncbi:hypothetical protein LCGC14_1438670 [marine sediment metagenome]|uniref:Uncharacterized protein n=1 Tax=marine sediment metagenome TaxID=412755 RepID=A0A0F9MN65_9ZZZZ